MIDKNRIRLLFYRFWWILLLSCIVAVVARFAMLRRQVASYTARAVVEVAQDEVRLLKVDPVRPESPAGMDFIATTAESLTGDMVILETVKKLGLYEDFKKGGMADAAVIDIFKGKVAARWRRGTRLIDVFASDIDPIRARNLANSLVSVYLARQMEQRSSTAGAGAEDLKKLLEERVEKDLEAARKKLNDFRLQHKDVPLDEQGMALSERNRELGDKLLELQAARSRIDADIKRIDGVAADNLDEMLKVTSLASIPAVQEARGRMEAQEQAFSDVKKRYLQKHPRYIRAAEDVAAARAALTRLLGDATPLLKEQAAEVARREQQLKDASDAMVQNSSKLGEILVPYRLLKEDVDRLQARYNEITTRIAEIGMREKVDTRLPVFLSQEAITPVNPDAAATTNLLIKSALYGLLAGAALVFLIDRLDQSYLSIEHVESDLGTSVLASIPDDAVEKRKLGGLPLITDRTCIQAEAYRTLRASLSLLGEEARRRVILVTSALAGEGKSRTSANLAIAFAQRGQKTLLIDADMRRPSQRLLFSTVSTADAENVSAAEARTGKGPGLAEYLSGINPLSEVCTQTPVDNLHVIFAGGRSPQPADLLSQQAFQDLIELSQQHFDRVIIDTPPVNSVSDAAVMAPHAHVVCLVIRAGRTPRREVKRAMENIKRAGGRLAGIILNRQRAGVYGYYYNYRSDPYLSAQKS